MKDDQEMEEVDEVDGQVTAVGTNQFTLMNERSGNRSRSQWTARTVFEGFLIAAGARPVRRISLV